MKRFFFPLIVLTLSILFQGLAGQKLSPSVFRLKKSKTSGDSSQAGLQSNVIIEIRSQGDSLVWFGTGNGLSVLRDSTTLRTFLSSSGLSAGLVSSKLPEGGVSAIGAAGNDTLLVAVATTLKGEIAGAGLALSYNSQDTLGASWLFFSQPVDSSGDSTMIWGGNSLKVLPITVPQQNVTYDIAVSNNYFWITSWASGLRRLNRNSVSSVWERVPLPEDGRDEMLCGEELPDYELNPRDPPQGNHNHKGFSVLAYSDTVWVGTANGINRGIVNESGCVDWEHYSYPFSGITGNWVVALARQDWNGERRIWAVTLRSDQEGEQNGVSYSPDNGLNWFPVSALRGQRGYNIFTVDSLVYVATENGLWKSEDGVNWALFKPAIDAVNSDQILDNDVYAVLHDTRDDWQGQDSLGVLWIGTGDGLAKSPDPGLDDSIWRIYRTFVTSAKSYAYPNPFSPTLHNILNGAGHVRFYYKARRPDIKLTVYNFAMEKVRKIEYTRGSGKGALKWDGKDSTGGLVANGTYFCNLFYDEESHWIKVIVLK